MTTDTMKTAKAKAERRQTITKVNVINSHMINPFKCKGEELMSISTG